MSIATKKGDWGITSLLFDRRVSKCDPRVEACGAVDELNAALGLARALVGADAPSPALLAVQHDLIILMSELATADEDASRFERSGFSRITPERTGQLDRWIQELEAQPMATKGWALPGESPASAALDIARTTCRRAERRVCALHETRPLANHEIIIYLNRLSDWLWLLARWVEARKP
jgi:cob(I)alamin adenosyltransferase